jgi:Zn-dependent peptidase ImmA (M78 family)
MTPPRMTADRIVKELGISEPHDIDIEAIAQYCGATILYEKLTGCEARIVGKADRAIITVNSDSRRGRQRFSAGHELGHWMYDRNRIGFSCTNAVFRSQWGCVNSEKAANEFAADLLLPQTIFCRYAYASPVTLEAVRDLATKFETSLAPTAIRLVQRGSFPAMVIYLAQGVRKWFVAGPDVPSVLSPRETPSRNTIAGELLRGGRASPGHQTIQADGWITHPKSQWYELVEDSVRFTDGSILSLLWWKNEKQILELMNDD